MKDYRIKITIRNERLLTAIESLGFVSVRQFCAQHALDYQRVTEIIRGKLKPLDTKGRVIKIVEELLEITGVTLEEAFTKRQLQGFHKASFEMKVVEKDLKKLINPIKNQEQRVIEQDVKLKLIEAFAVRLSSKEEKVIRLAYGFDDGHEHTLEEMGQIFGVSRSRIGQIKQRAERKLRHPSVASKIINTGFGEIYTKVNLTKKQISNAQKLEDAGGVDLTELKKRKKENYVEK